MKAAVSTFPTMYSSGLIGRDNNNNNNNNNIHNNNNNYNNNNRYILCATCCCVPCVIVYKYKLWGNRSLPLRLFVTTWCDGVKRTSL